MLLKYALILSALALFGLASRAKSSSSTFTCVDPSSALVDAAKKGDSGLVSSILTHNPGIDAVCLARALRMGLLCHYNSAVVKRLLKNIPRTQENADLFGIAIKGAVEHGNADIVENICRNYEHVPVLYIGQAFLWAAKSGNHRVLMSILARSRHLDVEYIRDGLIFASKGGFFQIVTTILATCDNIKPDDLEAAQHLATNAQTEMIIKSRLEYIKSRPSSQLNMSTASDPIKGAFY